MFAAITVLVGHDSADPTSKPGLRLIHANRAALALGQRPWLQMVGIPSRLTPKPVERASRRQALIRARGQEAIEGAGLWILRNGSGQSRYQAARFKG